MNYKAVWKPLPGSQSLSLSCPCNEILYEGTRGPGKTAAQLARFRRLVGLGYGSFWRGVIFDTEYKNLTPTSLPSQSVCTACLTMVHAIWRQHLSCAGCGLPAKSCCSASERRETTGTITVRNSRSLGLTNLPSSSHPSSTR